MNNGKNPRKNSTKQPMKKKGKQLQPQPQQQSAKVNNVQEKNETKSKVNNNNVASKKKSVVAEPVSKKETIAEVPKRVPEEPKKLERSSSFIGMVSKFYNKLSDSIENLTKIAKEPAETTSSITSLPFKFQRSLTLNSFQLKKSYRKSLLENSRLEKLSEEKISEGKTPSTPPKSPSPLPTTTTLRSRSPTNYRQTMPAGNFDTVDFTKEPPPQFKRSDSFISLIKRKISFNDMKSPLSPPPAAPAVAPSGTNLNRNWAMSLQNLQQIDNMVSYEGKLSVGGLNE